MLRLEIISLLVTWERGRMPALLGITGISKYYCKTVRIISIVE